MIIKCKHCNKKFFLGLGFGKHLLKEHNIDITINDKKWIRKRRIKLCLLPFVLVEKAIKYIIIGICIPFHLLYEWLVYDV